MIDFAGRVVQALNGEMVHLPGFEVLCINERKDSAFEREDGRRCVVGRLREVSDVAR